MITVEGRNHFVKRMFETLGYNVKNLSRKSFAGITAGNLREGSYRKISPEEIQKIIRKYEIRK